MRTVVRHGQKTWFGRTKKEVIRQASLEESQAKEYERGNAGDQEIARHYRESAEFLRHNARFMEPVG